jgi:uncharacterized protein YbjQ (UPF0145 family)
MEWLAILARFAELLVFALLIVVGYTFGRLSERRHYESIRRRERQLGARVLVFSNRFPPSVGNDQRAALVSGSVVVSEDYFKSVLSWLQGMFGGRVRSYESLLDRARREAVLRMKSAALRQGADLIVNVKFQTFRVPGAMGCVELLAYGTALRTGRGERA